MKFLIKENSSLVSEKRYDIDYHLPPQGILQFPEDRIVTVAAMANVSDHTRNPTFDPEEVFTYVDIASIDVQTGTITNAQELTGEEAPSRARKVIRAYDII